MRVLDFIAVSLFVWTFVALPFFVLNWFFYMLHKKEELFASHRSQQTPDEK